LTNAIAPVFRPPITTFLYPQSRRLGQTCGKTNSGGNMNKLLSGSNRLSRRSLLELWGAVMATWNLNAWAYAPEPIDPKLKEAIARLQYFTPLDRAFILDKGKAGVAKLPPDKVREIGLAPETWSLDVIPDRASNSVVEQPLSRASGNALTWSALMNLAEKHAVRFMQVCTCTNGADPFHMSLWEGVPLREVIRMTRPKDNVRRVYYQSYHAENLPPFQSSLPMSQILENPPGDMPVVLAYKMNDQLIPATHGGPVRMIVPGAYGSKCIKWVQRVVLTNDPKMNDSDADLNNDPENALKTRARFINEPKELPAGKPAAITGMAQIGISGLSKVQYCIHPQKDPWPPDDPYHSQADWKDVAILPPPENWGGGLPGGKLRTNQTDPVKGTPLSWPIRYAIVHWAATLPGLNPGTYDLCCRTIDANGIAQPLPRTIPRTGYNTLHVVSVVVSG
jgi:DMSO/TMAO reductase YedYZ molybdopterin-dependent catalytic subunit